MGLPIKIHHEANKEYIDAFVWYELEQEGTGYKFMFAAEKRLQQISEYPEFFGFIRGKYRQAKIPGFPYSIVYTYYPKLKIVHISSIRHEKRQPKMKFRKIK